MFNDPTFWVALGFVLFVILAFKKGKTAIVDILDKHSASVARQMDEAATLRREADVMMADARAKMDAAVAEAGRIATQAKEESARLKANTEAELAAMLARREASALEKITQAEAAALQQVRHVAIDVAIAATRALLTDKVQGAKGGALVDAAIADLSGRLN